jgi:hypothetical protein
VHTNLPDLADIEGPNEPKCQISSPGTIRVLDIVEVIAM